MITRSISKRNMMQVFQTKKDSEIISCEEDFSFSNMEACPLIRDAANNYKALERHFGVLTTMMAFGQSCLLNPEPKFFNAIALSDTVVLQLLKSDFEFILNSNERKTNNDKISFLKQMPQFKALALPRSKQILLCESMQLKKNQ
jgi:hypothetical protein